MRNFEHTKHPSLNFELESVTKEDGTRTYKTPTGKLYPSVTTVLSQYSKKGIAEWRKRVGDEAANKISRLASSRGTKLHSLCESYMCNCLTPIKLNSSMPDVKELFNMLRPVIDERIGKVFAVEQSLYSDKLRLAGKTDLIAQWDGESAVIDFKTAAKEKDEIHILNYFMQGAAYAEMYEEITGEPIHKIVILIASQGLLLPQIFVKDKYTYIPELYKYIDLYWTQN